MAMPVDLRSHTLYPFHPLFLQACTPSSASTVEERHAANNHNMPVPAKYSPRLQRMSDGQKHERSRRVIR